MHQDKGGALTFDIVFNVPAFKFKGVRKIPTTQFKLLEYSAVVMEEGEGATQRGHRYLSILIRNDQRV